jgi:hypothetical protein
MVLATVRDADESENSRRTAAASAPTLTLVEKALEETVEVEVEEIKTRVFTAEHLAAIALQTGRPKDKARLLQLIESGTLSSERFQNILEGHVLAGSWRKFEQQFLDS